MGARVARIAFAAYAMTLGLSIAIGWWHRHLVALMRAAPGTHDVGRELELVNHGYVALQVAGILALVALTRLPPLTRTWRLAVGAAATAALELLVGGVERTLIWGHLSSYAHVERVLRGFGMAQIALQAASEILLLVLALRVARAAASQWLRGATIAAIISRAVLAVAWLVPLGLGDWMAWPARACNVLIAVVCAGLAAVVTRLPAPQPPAPAVASDGKLSAAWRAPAQGIGLYLGGALVRVLFGLVGYALMAGARGASSLSALRELRGEVLLLAVLSGLAAVTMLVGLWRISRAPIESRASGPAQVALALGTLGFLLDGWSTSITADMLDGNLSAAFFAMKALPAIAGVSALLGMGLALALLSALANLATALDSADVAARARGAMGFVVGAGIALGLALAVGGHATELLLVFVMLAVPLAIVAAVQFLRVAVTVSRLIRERSV